MASAASRKTATRMPSRTKLTSNNTNQTMIQPHEFVDRLLDLSNCTDNLHKQLTMTLQAKQSTRTDTLPKSERATLALRSCNACLKSFSSVSRSPTKDGLKMENLPHLIASARLSLATLRELEESLPTKAVDICRATLKCVEECNLLGFTKSALLELIALHPFLCRQLSNETSTPVQIPPNKPQGILVHVIPKEKIPADLASVQLLYYQLSIRILLSLPNIDLLAMSSALSINGSLISQLPSLRQSLQMEPYANGTTTLFKLLCRATTEQEKPSSSTALIHFKIRSKALMLINHNHNLDLNLWWTQGWKFGLSLLRSAEDALVPYTNVVKPFWSNMIEFAQARNQSRFMEGKGWIDFCEGWMSIAKKLDDISSLQLIAKLLSNDTNNSNEDTDELASDLSALTLSADKESLFTKYNVILLTTTAKLSSKSSLDDLKDRDYSNIIHVLDSLKHLDLDDIMFCKAERNVDGIRRVIYNRIAEMGEMNPQCEKLCVLQSYLALWTEHQLQKSRSLSPPLLYGTLDSLLQLAQLKVNDSTESMNYLNRALAFIEPLKSPQANRLVASAFWNWSCTLFQDGKAGTEADCIPAVESCLKVAEDGIAMCNETIARHPNDGFKGDQEMLKIMIDQRPKRYELLAICYSKVHDNQSAYEAFCNSILSSLQTTSSPINREIDKLDDSHSYSILVKKAMQIGLSRLMLPPQDLSLCARAEKLNIDQDVKCTLIELQIRQIEERAWSDQNASSAVIHMILELIGSAGYDISRNPLKKARILLRLMEQIVLGPSVDLEGIHIPAVEVLFEEVRSCVQREDYVEDTSLKTSTMSFMLSAHMFLAIYYYRSSDTPLEGSSSALREARHTKEILKTILGTGGPRRSSILRDNNLRASSTQNQTREINNPSSKTRSVSTRQTTTTRVTRSRQVPASQTSKAPTGRATRPTAATRRVVKPATTISSKSLKSNDDVKSTDSNNNQFDDIERCYNSLRLLTEMLGILGHTFLRLDFLKLLRKICQSQQRKSENKCEDYLLASTTLAAEYVKIGKISRAGAVFAQVASMKEVPANKTSVSWISSQIEFNLRYSEYLAITENHEKR
ncbi:hypothetical protein E3Q22_01075 [Wallemia mellicola]|uniref:Separase n=1 Tax=Wallemia mellicola TaxID=1708541 RepID=A0A4T0MDV9_9BASI|nr:hypothetical protein E3Q22_01075 [Wallemia mellicola]TIB97164.1 hypothetical protein E3Q17_03518 [Wallemia mellicola]